MAGELAAGAGGAGDGPVSVGLTLDTSKWESQLNRASQSLDRAAGNMESRFQKTADKIKEGSEKSGERVKAFAAGFTGGALAGGLMGALEKVGELGKQAMFDLALGIDRAKERTLQLTRETAELNDTMARSIKLGEERVAAAATPEGQQKARDEEKSRLAGQLRTQEAISKRAAQGEDELNSFWNWDSLQLRAGRKLDAAKEMLQAKGQAAEQLAQQIRSRIKDIDEGTKRFFSPADNPALTGELDKFVEDLNSKIATIDMSPLEQQLAGIARRFNATSEMTEKAAEKIREFEQAAKQVEVTKAFEETVKQLEFEALTIGKTANEIKMLEAAAKGFNGDQLDRMKALLEANDARKKAYEKPELKRAEVALAGSRESAAAVIAAAGRGGANPAAAAQAKQVEQGNTMVNLLKTIAEQTAAAVAEQKRYAKLVQEQQLKAGFDVNVIDG